MMRMKKVMFILSCLLISLLLSACTDNENTSADLDRALAGELAVKLDPRVFLEEALSYQNVSIEAVVEKCDADTLTLHISFGRLSLDSGIIVESGLLEYVFSGTWSESGFRSYDSPFSASTLRSLRISSPDIGSPVDVRMTVTGATASMTVAFSGSGDISGDIEISIDTLPSEGSSIEVGDEVFNAYDVSSPSLPDTVPPADNEDIAVPEYVEIPVDMVSTLALEVGKDNIMAISYPVFYHWYAPIVTGFADESRGVAESGECITVLGNAVDISFREENGSYIYEGISEDGDTFYSRIAYDPATATFSYVQALTARFDMDGAVRDRIDIVRGDSIAVSDDGTLKGTVRHYFLQHHNDGLNGTELGVGDGEFFSGSKGSGTVFKGFLNCNSEEGGNSVYVPDIAGLSPSFSDMTSIISIGDEAIEANHKDSLDAYYGMIWYDRNTSSIFSKGDGSKGDEDIIASYDEAKVLVLEHCGTEWELSDPAALWL